MRAFFQCVAEAVVENGVKGLAEMVPGGGFAYAVAESVWKKWREKRNEQKLHDDMVKMAAAKLDEARVVAEKVAREVFAAVPAGASAPQATPDEIIDLELYLSAIPDAVRQSLKRPEDATGTTVPAGFSLRSADDVLKMLPPRPPRFRPGADLPGKPGWVLERLLGIGGFGEVWFAKHARMGSLSGAVKFCFGQSGRDLIHEADLIDRVMRAGSHPNIVPLKDAHLEGDRPWLMFEYVGGGTLTDWVHPLAALPPDKRLPVVLDALRQLCEAVAFFHALPVPVVHRDLKPSNILFDPLNRNLRITDFGIGSITAKETNRQESRGQTTHGARLLTYIRGAHTPTYSSPQQRHGADPVPQDDVHALGVIAYQMLTGKLEIAPGPRAGSTLQKVGVPGELCEVLVNCVSEQVDDRPKDGGQLLGLLAAVKAGEGTPLTSSAPHSPSLPRPGETEGLGGTSPAGVRETTEPLAPSITATSKQAVPMSGRRAGDRFHLDLPGGLKMAFAWCPPGTFLMGSPVTEEGRVGDEHPHEVRVLRGFFCGVHPVTQAEWKAVMNTDVSRFEGVNLPVECVSWDDAVAFCTKVTQLIRLPLRLPTEEEWEYACRGGTTTPFYWGTELNGTQANCDGNAPYGSSGYGPNRRATSPVGSFAEKFPHPWGLTDVHGNVSEWCADSFGSADLGVLRGGCWVDSAKNCRAAYRLRMSRSVRSDFFGFRVVFNPE